VFLAQTPAENIDQGGFGDVTRPLKYGRTHMGRAGVTTVDGPVGDGQAFTTGRHPRLADDKGGRDKHGQAWTRQIHVASLGLTACRASTCD
jgi:hypothetical protein